MRLRDVIISLAVGCLFFIGDWRNFVYPRNTFIVVAPKYAIALTSLLLAVVVVAAIVYLLLCLARATKKDWQKGALHFTVALFFLAPLNQVRGMNNFPIRFPILSFGWWFQNFGARGTFVIFLALVAIIALVYVRFAKHVIKFQETVLTCMAGFAAIMLCQVVGEAVRIQLIDRSAISPDKAELTRPHQRIVLQIYDEMGHFVVDRKLRGKQPLPNLDKFAGGSWTAANAIPPGTMTRISIPSYLNGERPHRDMTLENDSNDYLSPLNVFFNGEDRGNLFFELKKRGYRTAVVGWHVPYCRYYGAFLDQCITLRHIDYDFTDSVVTNVKRAFRRATMIKSRTHADLFVELKERALEVVKDPTIDFVFLHWPVPHPPGIYGTDKKIILQGHGEDTYESYKRNLTLADQTVGEVRQALESANLWDRSVVVVTSDHSVQLYRDWVNDHADALDRRVPFMVKMPNQQTNGMIHEPLQLIDLKKMIVAVSEGNLPWIESSWKVNLDKARYSRLEADASDAAN